jgi:DNA modification methylase
MVNLSQIKREQMVSFLETLKQQHSDDESLAALDQIEKELTSKKYGLVWEEHEEEGDVKLQTHIPVFTEVEEKEIPGDPDSGDYNFLLEGDNLHSLTLLEKTHREKIDVIYIDPPYNTGHKDFIYDDSFVDKEDGYSHSKWISFMEKRLRIAHALLKADGTIFISIDDNEYANLKLLCDEIFGEKNMISDIIWNSRKSVSNDAVVSLNHNYTLVYAKNMNRFNKVKHLFKLSGPGQGFLSDETKGTTPKSLWDDCGTAAAGTKELVKIFGERVFDTPKPTGLIKKIIDLAGSKNSLILDFFAGSGTTGQAVLDKNFEDGGNRHFILCTNNDGEICSRVTYPRLTTVITGKRSDGSEYSEGRKANLKYYRTEFVDKESEELYDDLMEHTKEMIQLQYGVKLDNEKFVMIMDGDEMDDFEQNFHKYNKLEAVFINHDVLLTASQERMLQDIKTQTIPNCYFNFELREAGKVW